MSSEKDFLRKMAEEFQEEVNELGVHKLTKDGIPGLKTLSIFDLYDVEMVLTPKKIDQTVSPTVAQLPSGDYFGATWMGLDLDLLGQSEFSKELQARYVPEWKRCGLPHYNTLIGIKYAWCLLGQIKVLREVGANIKGLTVAARSVTEYGESCPFWFGCLLPIKHAGGGRHGAFFLYWIDEKRKIAATLDRNRSNLFAVFATDLSGSGDTLVGGPRWPTGWPAGKLISKEDVLARYPQFAVKGSGSSTR
jgi:hypothetical protein